MKYYVATVISNKGEGYFHTIPTLFFTKVDAEEAVFKELRTIGWDYDFFIEEVSLPNGIVS